MEESYGQTYSMEMARYLALIFLCVNGRFLHEPAVRCSPVKGRSWPEV
jgi:hypothetical protein